MVILVTIILLIIVIFLVMNKKKEHFINIKFHDKNSIDKNAILRYLNKLSIKQLEHKTDKKTDRKDMINTYLNRIQKFNDKEKEKITDSIISISSKYKNWNLVKVHNIEFDFPFTLNKYIFLPKNILEYDLKEILLHERTHVDQRFYQEKYNYMYKKLYGKYIFPINNKLIDYTNIQNIRIVNPDEDDNTWLIKNNGKLYVVPYIKIFDNIYTNRAYQVINYKVQDNYILDEKLDYYKSLPYKNIILTHPNETDIERVLEKNNLVY